MPIITCPKCQGNMRFPEDIAARRVKCPSCGNIFLPTELPAIPAPPPRPSGRHAAPRRSRDEDRDDDRTRRRRNDEGDDERDDRDRRSRRRTDEDDDRDRRRRPDDDDDDRRAGSRRRRNDEADDYDDRRPRRRESASAIEGRFDRASLGLLLNFIGGWLQVGALALVAFVVALDWAGVNEGLRVFLVIAGLLGIGYWLTSATGFGFMVSGPRERGALGLSIATAAVAGVHLLLIIVIATSRTFGGFGGTAPGRAAEVHWEAFVTQARAIPILLFLEIGVGDFYRDVARGSVLPVLTNLVEVARLVLYFLALRAFMLCARDTKGARFGMQAMVGYAIGAGVLILLGVLFGLLMLGVRPTRPGPGDLESMSAVLHLFFILLYLCLAGLAIGAALVTRTIKGRIDYRR